MSLSISHGLPGRACGRRSAPSRPSLPRASFSRPAQRARSLHCVATATGQARSAAVAPAAQLLPDGAPPAAAPIVAAFQAAPDGKARLRLLLEYARQLPPFPEEFKVVENRVMGCSAQAWVHASLDPATGAVALAAASDSQVTAGLAGVLVAALSGLRPAQILDADGAWLRALGLSGAAGALAPSRAAGFANMLEAVKRRVRMLTAELPRFPSLLISGDKLEPQGAFAEAQAQFLHPDATAVGRLASVLREKRIGVVAHFYMDPQVQGVLSAAAEQWPHVHISDSLVMADAAVRMAEAGCQAVAVLGVDFMSENVRAILDEAGHTGVKVYRMSSSPIGCSLAEAAESDAYNAYLAEAGATPTSLHVVYINTSLLTKATANALVPTITCTSSNVVQTILQAFAQVPDLTVWYGPDTYMGRNLAALFTMLADAPDADVAALHPAHTAASVRALLPRLRYFDAGTCIVHHIFGGEVCELVRAGYGDAYLTAHFEVPGEMFGLAMEAKARGMGCVGSTSNILDFITAKLKDALAAPYPDRLQFVLGTEAGMITSIVRRVQSMVKASGRADVEVEIVFPVAPQAITTPKQAQPAGAAPLTLPGGLAVVPGPAGGEGCSLDGGCAACPYMKMNTLDALLRVCDRVGSAAGEASLEAYRPRAYAQTVGGASVAAAGCMSILHMRDFTRARELSPALVGDIRSRHAREA